MRRARCSTGPVASALFTLSEVAGQGPRRRLEHPPGRRSPPTTPATATPPRWAPRTRSATRPACKSLAIAGDDAARAGAGQGDRRRRRVRPRTRQPAAEHLQPGLPGAAGAGIRRALRQGRVRSARPRRRWTRWAWARCSPSAQGSANRAEAGRAEVEQRRRRQALRAGRQGHHLRHRRHQPQDRRAASRR